MDSVVLGGKEVGKGSWTILLQVRVIPNQLGTFATRRDKERVRAGVWEGGEVPLCHFGPGIIV